MFCSGTHGKGPIRTEKLGSRKLIAAKFPKKFTHVRSELGLLPTVPLNKSSLPRSVGLEFKSEQKGLLFFRRTIERLLALAPKEFAIFGTRKFRAAPCLTGLGWVWALGGLECASEAEHPFEFEVVPDLVGFELRWHEHPSSPLRGRSDMVG